MAEDLLPLDDQLLRTLLDNLEDGVYFTDTQRRIRYWNKGAERLTGFLAGEVVGHCCADNILKHVDSEGNPLCMGHCPLAATVKDGEARKAKVFFQHKDGHRVPVLVAVAPIYDDSGSIVGGVETFHDLSTEMAALREVEGLRDEALLCPLTGVGNRRYAEQMLAQKVDENRQNGGRLAVFFCDVDRFKQINDQYGHDVGDVVLKMVARTMANTMRPHDFLARWGGEEFVALLPGVRPIELEGVSDRLRKMVASASRKVSRNRLAVTVSVGATLVRNGEEGEAALARADSLMYRSKHAGRNRVTVEP